MLIVFFDGPCFCSGHCIVKTRSSATAEMPKRDIGSDTPLAFNVPDGEVPLGRSPQNFAQRSMDG